MEPAAERRDDSPGGLVAAIALLAAMEPAAERRDDERVVWVENPINIEPQWSPPLSGGTTPMRPPGSPPARPAAMEPAAERRDDVNYVIPKGGPSALPQWSPPLSGGTTGFSASSWLPITSRNGARR